MLEKVIGIYSYHQTIKAPDGTTITLEGHAAGKGRIVKLLYMAISDETTANKLLKIGIKDASGKVMPLAARQATQWKCTRMVGCACLLTGEKPVGIVTTPTTNDLIHFAVHGLVFEAP